jgi:predicted nucleotidyltransferase
MEITRNVSKWGNGAGILLPKEWIGNQVRIILVNRTLEIKKEVFSILEPYMDEIAGIYLVGSYARGEETETSDIDVLVIANTLKKEIISGKYHISIISIASLKKTLEGRYPELILPRLAEAKVLLNKNLIEELKQKEFEKKSFADFIKDTRRIIKINKEVLELDKLDSEFVESKSVIYSLVLRLRGFFLIKCLLDKTPYSHKSFKKWISLIMPLKDFEQLYQLYSDIKLKKKTKIQIRINDAEKLINFLELEIEKW